MLFNSFTFGVFFLIVFILFWLPVRKYRLQWQNIVILVAGYIFYGWWDWRFLFLIALTSLTSWASGILIEKQIRPKLISAANIIINIGILICFKYFNFFTDSLVSLFSLFGIQTDMRTLNIILPVGISFYTFQALSYSIDVYKGKIKACKNPVKFFAFVSFFPALVAGPIERASNLLPQFDHSRDSFDYNKAVIGVTRVLWGLFLKIVIADRLAVFVNGAWDGIESLSWLPAVTAMIFFAFQLYLDFYAYSEIAKGIAVLLGFEVMTNFRRPYLSTSFKEFWKRWHISLSSWFMDYVYIPLGGNRRGEMRKCLNLMIVFLLSGLWHGSSWTFVLWGAMNGFFLVFFDRILKKGMRINSLIVFLCWTLSLILFRAQTLHDAWNFILHLGTGSENGIAALFNYGLVKSEFYFAIAMIIFLVIWEFIQEKYGERLALWLTGTPAVFRVFTAALVIVVIILFGRYGIGNDGSFIYFQF